MRTYEVLFILSPQVAEEEATTLVTELKRVAETTGATLKNEEAWGRRRLAYPIQKFNEGIYHLFFFESDSSLSELDRRMKNSDRILRHMIVRTDEELKRAEKLAKKNPKKERRPIAPATPSGMSGSSMSAAPAAEPAESAAPAAAPAPEAETVTPAASIEPDAETSADTAADASADTAADASADTAAEASADTAAEASADTTPDSSDEPQA
jgi:small subunit ribosomal protein S6